MRAALAATRDAVTVVRSFGTEERARRAQIIDQARALASEQGYQGLTIRAVASAANTTPVTIYRYFGSKDGLAQQLMADWSLETLNRLQALEFDEEVTEAERLADAFSHLIDWAAEDRNLLDAGLSSIHTASSANSGIGLWQPLFVELVRAALGEPDWQDDEHRALILGHVLTTCLLDLTAGSGDTAAIQDTIATACRLLFDA